MSIITRSLGVEVRAVDEKKRTISFRASDETVDHYEEVVKAQGWILRQWFRKNPMFLWSHDYHSLPIGLIVKAWIDKGEKALMTVVKFPTAEEYPFADQVYRLYLAGYLRAVSVGFKPLEWEDDVEMGKGPGKKKVRRVYTKQELVEVSAVTIPANPNALIAAAEGVIPNEWDEEGVRGMLDRPELRTWEDDCSAFGTACMVIRSMAAAEEEDEEMEDETKGALPYKETGKDPKDADWDGPAEVAAAEVPDLKLMCAWVDPDKADVKSGYKLPHHRASGHNVVWRGVAAAMARLNQAGTQIPDADRRGVYNHLKKHYKQFDEEPPELKSIEQFEFVGAEWRAGVERTFEELKKFWNDHVEEGLRVQLELTRLCEGLENLNAVIEERLPRSGAGALPGGDTGGSGPAGWPGYGRLLDGDGDKEDEADTDALDEELIGEFEDLGKGEKEEKENDEGRETEGDS